MNLPDLTDSANLDIATIGILSVVTHRGRFVAVAVIPHDSDAIAVNHVGQDAEHFDNARRAGKRDYQARRRQRETP